MPALALALLSGCAAGKKGAPVSDTLAVSGEAGMTDMERFARDYRTAGSTRMQEQWAERAGSLVVDTAKSALGTAYVRGGTSRAGFDCSGLVQWAYRHVGVSLPRTAREQARVGEPVDNIEDLRVGDIVAFRHPRRGYHTGIYTGDGKFIHSPRRRQTVRIASLNDPYFRTTFLGARRVEIPPTMDIDAVEKKLTALANGKKAGAVQVASLGNKSLRSAENAGKAKAAASKKRPAKSKAVSRVSSRASQKTASAPKATRKAPVTPSGAKAAAAKAAGKTASAKKAQKPSGAATGKTAQTAPVNKTEKTRG